MLDFHVLLRDKQLLLRGANDGVDIDHRCRQQNLGLVVGGDRGHEGRVCRFDTAPEPAPEVHLPCNADAAAERPVGVVHAAVGRRRQQGGVAAGHLHLRVLEAGGHAELGLRLQHAYARDLDAVVVAPRRLNQFVEHGVVEDLPPLDQFVRRRVQAFRRFGRPVVPDRCLGLFVVRSDGRATSQQQPEQGCRCQSVSCFHCPAFTKASFVSEFALDGCKRLAPVEQAVHDRQDRAG